MLVVVAEHCVVDRQDRATRVTKYDADAFVGNDLHDDVGAGEARAGERVVRWGGLQLRVHIPGPHVKSLSHRERVG
jgi:hypothetical protein